MKTIIIMGAPGTGKGTFSQMLKENIKISHISTGDLFRENITKQTPIGIKAKWYIEKGSFVPDDVTDEMVRQRLKIEQSKKSSILLDGYPRNIHQASKIIEFFKQIGRKIDFIIWLNTKESIIIERIINRLICRNCNQVYNLKHLPPKIENECDNCQEKLYHRKDDNKKAVTQRLKTYNKETLPLINYYRTKIPIIEIDTSTGDIEKNYEKIITAFTK